MNRLKTITGNHFPPTRPHRGRVVICEEFYPIPDGPWMTVQVVMDTQTQTYLGTFQWHEGRETPTFFPAEEK